MNVRLTLPLLLIASLLRGQQPAYDFSAIDNLLQANLQSVFNDRVVCMVSRGDTLIYYQALGQYDSMSLAPIASCTKTFSGAVMLSLAGDGILSLDDTVGKYLPQFTARGKGDMTLRQCFAHTAGFNQSDLVSNLDLTLQQCADSIAQNVPTPTGPGAFFRYGGTSMQVAGAAAEVASGQSWTTLLQQRLTGPLGLGGTFFCQPTANPQVAGGMCSRPRDLLRFAQFILKNGVWNGDTIIAPYLMEELWRDQTNSAPQLYTPYPTLSAANNPYGADEVYYGIGSWLDIYNPAAEMQEQISGAGAFGSIFWINRCHNTAGVLFTLSQFPVVAPVAFAVMDAVRTAVPYACPGTTSIVNGENPRHLSIQVYPNPAEAGQVELVLPADAWVELIDLTGRTLLRQFCREGHNTLDLTDRPKGIYLVKTPFETRRVVYPGRP